MTLVCNLPFPRNVSFIGHGEVLGNLFQSVGRRNRVQALTGLGGMGKTHVAVEYLLRFQQRYEFIFWLDACTRERVCTQIRDVFLLDETAEEALFAHAKWWLRDTEKWLVVLDHLEDLTLIDALISPQPPGQVLLTTPILATGGWAKSIRLAPLDPDAGALLLLRRARLLAAHASLDEVYCFPPLAGG